MITRIPQSIQDNLRFLIVEVSNQVISLQTFFASPSESAAQQILARSGYAFNLKTRIHDSCYSHISGQDEKDAESLIFRAIESIATNLEQITELCRECVQQVDQLHNQQRLQDDNYKQLLDRVIQGIDLINRAIAGNNTPIALKIGKIEYKLEQDCKKLLKKYTAELKQRKNTEDLITSLFIAQSVEQMGDALLNISEAVISANLGQPLNTDRYRSLQASIEHLNQDDNPDLNIETIAETRSGSTISAISTAEGDNQDYVAIFKDGKKRKLKEERQSVESWHEIFPGLAPKILAYHKQGQSAALLIEHLAGQTFEQILLRESPQLLQEALQQLYVTLESIWAETHSKKQVPAQYMSQLSKRLDDVYAIHPEFRNQRSNVCGYQFKSFDTLVKQAHQHEMKFKPPFSVYIHGDFNADNIIYDPEGKKINFVDLHRSRYMDYIQDVSVFMVSNYRLQILDVPLRKRILEMTRDFYDFAAAYAEKTGDKNFDLRLALGLARSFATSTRFILDKSLAKAMFLRSCYLIEQVLATPIKQASSYRIPIREIFVG